LNVRTGRASPDGTSHLSTRRGVKRSSGRRRKSLPREREAQGRSKSRRRPTLPRRCQRSTIGAEGLNFRVRNGNGCGPFAMAAGTQRIPQTGSELVADSEPDLIAAVADLPALSEVGALIGLVKGIPRRRDVLVSFPVT